MLHLQVDNVAKRLSFSAKSIWSLCKTGVMHTFDATEIFAFFAFFRAHYLHFQCDRDFCILQSSISKCQHIFSNELQSLSCHFDNAVHESLLQTAVLCSISTRSLMEIGQCSSCGWYSVSHQAGQGSGPLASHAPESLSLSDHELCPVTVARASLASPGHITSQSYQLKSARQTANFNLDSLFEYSPRFGIVAWKTKIWTWKD